jgi:hypothetical protein
MNKRTYLLQVVAQLDARFVIHILELDDDVQCFALLPSRLGLEIVREVRSDAIRH